MQPEDMLCYHVPVSLIERSGRLFDIRRACDVSSNCFTKSYGRYVEGSGSVLETSALLRKEGDQEPASSEAIIEELKLQGLRFFSPREMLNLHGFPSTYQLPTTLSDLQADRKSVV